MNWIKSHKWQIAGLFITTVSAFIILQHIHPFVNLAVAFVWVMFEYADGLNRLSYTERMINRLNKEKNND